MDVSVEKLYFADTGNRRIRSVDLNSGIIDTIAGGGSVEVGDGLDAKKINFSSHPMRVAIDDTGNFLVSDAHHNRIRKIDKDSGIITTVAGNGVPGYTGDNVLATESSLNVPHGARCDSEGNIYIADTNKKTDYYYSLGKKCLSNYYTQYGPQFDQKVNFRHWACASFF